MTHMGLFEGIGGFSLAAEMAGWNTPVMVEWSTYCQAVLKKNFPDATIFSDIRNFDGRPYAGQIDIITGGFPCQPFSAAGKRAGTNDDRYLWPEMYRIIREVAPEWVIGENVAGLLSMDGGRVFAGILADLEASGYSTEVYNLPAIGLGAPHKRDRVWIVAHAVIGRREWWSNNERQGQTNRIGSEKCDKGVTANATRIGKREQNDQAHTVSGSREAWEDFSRGDWRAHWYEVATQICGMDDGFPAGLDGIRGVPAKTKTKAGKAHRLEALGNAIVPQIAYQIFKAINQTKEHDTHPH